MNKKSAQIGKTPTSLTNFRAESRLLFLELEKKVRDSETLICPDSHPRALASLNIAKRQTKELAQWLEQLENVPSDAYTSADLCYLVSRMNHKVSCVESHLVGVNDKASDDKWFSFGFLFIILGSAAYAAFRFVIG